jgi:UDP-glucose:(heptosyl)LPS alpha-1,3-glucosyltransferase
MTQEKRGWKRLLMWFSMAFSLRQIAWLWLERRQFTYHRDRMFVAVSGMVQKDVQANYALPHECFHIAYPGSDNPMKRGIPAGGILKDLRSELNLTRDEVVILFVGTEFKRKGLDALLNALSLLSPLKLRLVVAGGGGGKMKRYVELTKNLGLNQHVAFLGLVENVGELYALADAIILPTLSDPWAMAPMEAMMAGVPAAVSSAEYCGAAEYIQGGEALIIKNPADPVEIKEAIIKLMDPGFRNELSRKGQALAAQLTWERTTASTLAAYDEVLRRKAEETNP